MNGLMKIIVSYVKNHYIKSSDLPCLIANIYVALNNISVINSYNTKNKHSLSSINTVNSDYIVSLEDGKRYKLLKRHLASRNLSPDQYRAKWGLPDDYPMVPLNYAARRSEIARDQKLGHKKT
ncbi:MucR family transcriptional regulator [Methylobacterium oryzihabitans]|uniref:MucR family transcriptional regulator n=1 Tax=Methylobacterium oryzihabitans TaxID=2499852 RepID=A0A3S2VB05_9HYPH|nr:MucR family transcriptional regulator [Methylobacterium oryzihabitans]RVU18444.1 MucR family transcriptional regulator [Methylobacterium oryzihabitans]